MELKPRLWRKSQASGDGSGDAAPLKTVKWRCRFDHPIEGVVAGGGRRKTGGNGEVESTALYEEIGRLKVKYIFGQQAVGRCSDCQ
jgi:hypothetical protein